jgi:hypothetical protein
MFDDNKMSTTINLTERQADWAEWSLEEVLSHFQAMQDGPEVGECQDMPDVDGLIMHLPTNVEVIAHLLEVLETLAPERIREQHLPSSMANGALALAQKIRAVTGIRSCS